MIIQYDLPISARRSQLLDHMTLDDRILNVDLVSPSLLRTIDFQFNETLIPKKFQQRNDKNATTIVSSLLAAGYKLKKNAYEEAKKMDKMTRFNRFFLIGNAIERIMTINEKYGITDKMRFIVNTTTNIAGEMYHRYMPARLQKIQIPTYEECVDLMSTIMTLSFESATDTPDLLKIDPNTILQKIDVAKSMIFPSKVKKYQ